MRLGVIGAPYNSAGLTTGEARAPDMLRSAGLVAALQRSADVVDHGDVRVDLPSPMRDQVTGIIAPAVLAGMVDVVRAEVGPALREGRFPAVVGGECPLIFGCLAAARDGRGRAGLLFVNGHEDAWPPHTP